MTTKNTTTTKTDAQDVLKAAEARIAELEAKLKKAQGNKTFYACQCGCGQSTQGRFAPGHDAKLKSRLIGMYRSGKADMVKEAEAQAEKLGWTKFLTDAPASSKEKRDAMKAELAQLRAALEAAKRNLS